ncbi:MAG: DUF1801 domain-containing protein [Pseudomonadota bacterium]
MVADLHTELRSLIRQTAVRLEHVGELVESTKWGQPSFAPAKPRIGSSVRLQTNDDGTSSLMFICNTGLVDQFRAMYGDALTFIGNREIKVEKLTDSNRPVLMGCVSMALTYHLSKRAAKT